MNELKKVDQEPEKDSGRGATAHAEAEQPKASPKKPARVYEIDIFEAWCKACGICVAFCPKKCLVQDEEGTPVIAHPELCNGCGWCEIHCPDFAISVREKKARRHRELNEEDDGV